MRRRDFLGTVVGAAVMQSGAFGSVFAGREADVSATVTAPIGASSIRNHEAKRSCADGDWSDDRAGN